MTTHVSRVTACLVAFAVTGVLEAQDPVGDVKKVLDATGAEVRTRCTPLAEQMTTTGIRDICVDSVIGEQEAILTKAAYTHVRMRPGEPEAVLDPNTLVRFDEVNRWLIRRGRGGLAVLNRRAKLELVFEALGTTVRVGSLAVVEFTERGLRVHVAEGGVLLGVPPSAITLAAAETGWIPKGGAPVRLNPSAAELARLERKTQVVRWIMSQSPAPPARASTAPPAATGSVIRGPATTSGGGGGGGGGGGKAAAVILGLGAAGAGAYYLLTRDQSEDLKPDLVALADAKNSLCQFVGQTQTFVATVANQGSADAPSSTTRVTLTGAAGDTRTTLLPVQGLVAGQSVQVGPLTLPKGCPDCGIEITVDANGDVDESNEGNNTLAGRCLP